ncbi:hypothetical protein [Sulfurimonas sp.]|uniref:hypothetical protein n=1 Tax=Sulfurimonas sp. TaxID=2022749 RepID=UPI0025D244B8|nr:hypothetical protein [Sulfurimonas sp.]
MLVEFTINQKEKAILLALLHVILAPLLVFIVVMIIDTHTSLIASGCYMFVMSLMQYYRLNTTMSAYSMLKSELYFEFLMYVLAVLVLGALFLLMMIVGGSHA